jgi:hypothetical protein
MATRPSPKVITNSSVDVLNAIRNSASINYKNYVPIATKDADVIRQIGKILFDHPELRDEFTGTLVNRITAVKMVQRVFYNKMAIFKKGIKDFGETIEEVFNELAKPFQFDVNTAETELFKRVLPVTRVAFHVMNYQKFYKITTSREQIKTAFLSVDGVSEYINSVITQVFQAHEYDEYQIMKYMIATHILAGRIKPVEIPAVTTATLPEVVSTIKEISNNFEFRNPNYNIAQVRTVTPKADQFILCDTKLDAKMTTELLAFMFNMEVGDVQAKRMTIDGFGNLDNDRLAELFKDDPAYTAITPTQSTALSAIPAVLLDTDWFMVYDDLAEMGEVNNVQGLYLNTFYHTWKTFSVSPFSQIALFIPATPTVTSVAVTPKTATSAKGSSLNLSATVVTTNFAPQTVDWSVTGGTASTITADGKLTIGSGETATSLTVTATSTFDGTKKDTATITVS